MLKKIFRIFLLACLLYPLNGCKSYDDINNNEELRDFINAREPDFESECDYILNKEYDFIETVVLEDEKLDNLANTEENATSPATERSDKTDTERDLMALFEKDEDNPPRIRKPDPEFVKSFAFQASTYDEFLESSRKLSIAMSDEEHAVFVRLSDTYIYYSSKCLNDAFKYPRLTALLTWFDSHHFEKKMDDALRSYFHQKTYEQLVREYDELRKQKKEFDTSSLENFKADFIKQYHEVVYNMGEFYTFEQSWFALISSIYKNKKIRMIVYQYLKEHPDENAVTVTENPELRQQVQIAFMKSLDGRTFDEFMGRSFKKNDAE